MKAAHAAKNNTTLHPKEFKEVRVQKYINILGATPKDIKSLKVMIDEVGLSNPIISSINISNKKHSEWTADTLGEINYFCMVHPWMVGQVMVR